MLSTQEQSTLETASSELLDYALDPKNWLLLERMRAGPGSALPSLAHQRRVGALRVVVTVDILPTLDTYLRVSFFSPDLTPLSASDHLATVLSHRVMLSPNTEWLVEIDSRRWIHFSRRWTTYCLEA